MNNLRLIALSTFNRDKHLCCGKRILRTIQFRTDPNNPFSSCFLPLFQSDEFWCKKISYGHEFDSQDSDLTPIWKVGSISDALLCLVYPPLAFVGGARAPFPYRKLSTKTRFETEVKATQKWPTVTYLFLDIYLLDCLSHKYVFIYNAILFNPSLII